MDKPKVYEGHEPYVFISYAHANAPAVMQVAEELSAQGFRIWYDEGIEVGSEWPEYIASHLAGSGLMLAFMSNAYMRSDNCRREMHYALTKKIPVVTVFLEDTVMTPGMEMQIGSLFALMKYTMRDEVFYEKLFSAPQLSDALRSTAPPRKPRLRRHAKVPVDLNVESRRHSAAASGNTHRSGGAGAHRLENRFSAAVCSAARAGGNHASRPGYRGGFLLSGAGKDCPGLLRKI